MTTLNDTIISGHALYLELIRSDATAGYCQQFILTPEGKTTDGRVVPMTMYRRRLSTNAPRKTWQQIGSAHTAAFAMETCSTISDPADRLEAIHNQLTSFMVKGMQSIADNNYTLRISPIIVEVTPIDMDDIKNGKTPYKLLGRFWKVRKVLGFPKDVIPERVHPSTTVL